MTTLIVFGECVVYSLAVTQDILYSTMDGRKVSVKRESNSTLLLYFFCLFGKRVCFRLWAC